MQIFYKINRLKHHQGFKRYFANTSWLMGERILRMVVALFVGVYVARYLGPERFGLLNYANSFVGLFLALATLGLDGIVVRELVKTPERREELLGTAFGLKIVGVFFMWLAIVFAVSLTNNNNKTNTLIAIIAFAAIFQAFNVIDFNYQAEVKSKYVVYAQLIQLIVSSIAQLILIFIQAPLIWFAWVYCFNAVVLAVCLAVMYLYHTGKIWFWKWRWQVAKKLLQDSWPLILSQLLVSIYVKIDQVMIKAIMSPKDVGYYAVATQLSTAWYVIPIAITGSLFPAIVNARKESLTLYHNRLQNLYDSMIWLAIVVALIIFILSENIIIFLFGIEYIQASSVLSIAIFAGIFTNIGLVNNKYFSAENRLKDILYRSILGVSINIILNIFLIKIYGINGAALATVAAQVSTSIIYTCLKKDSRILFFMSIKSINIRRYFKYLSCRI